MKKKFILLIQNKFVIGGFFFTAANLFIGFLNYLFSSLSGKLLGPAGYGEIAALFSYLAIFAFPMQIVNAELIRRLGQKGSQRMIFLKSWENWFWSRVFHWKFLLIPYFLTLLLLPKFTNLSSLFSLTLLILLLISFLSTIYTGLLQGVHLFLWFSIISIIATLIKFIGPLLVYFKIDGLPTIAFFLILSSLSIVILGKRVLSKFVNIQKTDKLLADKVIEKRITSLIFNRSVLIIAVSTLSFSLLNNFDVIFIKKFFTGETAGIYSVWNLFSKFVYYLSAPLIGLSYIFFSDRESKKQHFRILVFTVIFFIAAGIGLYGLYYFFGKFLLLLIFNEKYLAILPYLPKAAVFGILYSLFSVLNGFFVAKSSYSALTVSVFIIFQAITLFLFGKSIEAVININLLTALLITISYLCLSFNLRFRKVNSEK